MSNVSWNILVRWNCLKVILFWVQTLIAQASFSYIKSHGTHRFHSIWSINLQFQNFWLENNDEAKLSNVQSKVKCYLQTTLFYFYLSKFKSMVNQSSQDKNVLCLEYEFDFYFDFISNLNGNYILFITLISLIRN